MIFRRFLKSWSASKTNSELQPLWPGKTEGCDHPSNFIADTAVNLKEEEEVENCSNCHRNQREDDVVERYEQFVDKDKESHDCRRENDVEYWLFLDFDRDVALEEVSDEDSIHAVADKGGNGCAVDSQERDEDAV